MNDADRFWQRIVGPIRQARGLYRLTSSEAKRAFDEAGESDLLPAEIEGIVNEVVSGELSVWDFPPEGSWISSVDSELRDTLLSSQGLVEEDIGNAIDDLADETDNSSGLDGDNDSQSDESSPD